MVQSGKKKERQSMRTEVRRSEECSFSLGMCRFT